MRKYLFVACASVLACGTANAAELVQNGGFENVTGITGSSEFGASYHTGQAVDGWTSAGGNAFNLIFFSANEHVDADTRYSPANGGEPGQYLYSSPASPTGGKFVALDGDTGFNGALTQTVGGLTIGKSYTLTFDWAAGQYADRSGDTTEKLVIDFGGESFTTETLSNPSGGFTGWRSVTHMFTATSTSQLLSFLSIGTPNGMPPVALLDSVSLQGSVPEPATWGMFIGGFGLIGGAARRRRANALTA
ncbi:MAG TPA: PEPxxWA-CTERM sorting domain-containing protein [Sphingomonas sp.]|nr:PEPxxWA-CTERM sorting domain-containing protein [Sphingomonas sp.]